MNFIRYFLVVTKVRLLRLIDYVKFFITKRRQRIRDRSPPRQCIILSGVVEPKDTVEVDGILTSERRYVMDSEREHIPDNETSKGGEAESSILNFEDILLQTEANELANESSGGFSSLVNFERETAENRFEKYMNT